MKLKSVQEVSDEVKKAQDNLAETEHKRVTEVLEREAVLQRKIASVVLELESERAGRQSSQAHLFEANEGTAELEAAWDAQRKILMDDNDRLREQLYEASRERDDLRLRATMSKNDTVNHQSTTMDTSINSKKTSSDDVFLFERAAYEAELNELTTTTSTLREDIASKEKSIMELEKSFKGQISGLESECSKLSLTVSSLRTELDAAPSVDMVNQMKHELRILKRLEYNVEDTDGDHFDHEDPERTAEKGGTYDVESILVTRLKKMEAMLLRERREKEDNQTKCEHLKNELVSEQEARSKVESLVSTLEVDLNRVGLLFLSKTTIYFVLLIKFLLGNYCATF